MVFRMDALLLEAIIKNHILFSTPTNIIERDGFWVGINAD